MERKTINAEWIDYRHDFRLYDPEYPNQTMAYADDLEEERKSHPEYIISEDRILYLAYGSNMNHSQMARRCPSAAFVDPYILEDYALKFRGTDGHCVATIEQEKGRHVPAALWKISASDEKSLDSYEGFPHLYRKIYLQTQYGAAMAYVMNKRPLGRPSEEYLSIIAEGYLNCKFSDTTPLIESAVMSAVSNSIKEGTEDEEQEH